MYLYIALFAWAAATVNAYAMATTKLAGFTLVTGLVTIYLIYFQGLGFIGQTILCLLALIAFLGEKLLNVKSR